MEIKLTGVCTWKIKVEAEDFDIIHSNSKYKKYSELMQVKKFDCIDNQISHFIFLLALSLAKKEKLK